MSQHIFRPIDITSVQTDRIICKHDVINFFEIVFIEEGTGLQRINQASIPFGAGAIFLLLPDERCTIDLAAPARIHLIRFLPTFFSKCGVAEAREQLKRLEFVLYSANRQVYPLLPDERDQRAVTDLLRVLIADYHTYHEASHEVQRNLLTAILSIIIRNLRGSAPTTASPKNQALLSFIQYHISEPDQLTIQALSRRFSVAESYFSEYFQTAFGLSLKQYIIEYKLNLVESRLAYTNLTVSEIAAELSFTDSSHLKRTYLNYRQKPLPKRSGSVLLTPNNVH